MKRIHKIGNRYNRLVIVKELPKGKWGQLVFLCKCDCGNYKKASSAQLSCRTQSCGCLQKYNAKKMGYKNRKYHGEYDYLLERNTLNQMMNRCYHPTNKKYKYWGGKGIKVCDRWNTAINKKAYKNFINDMGRRPDNKTSIDRINNNGDYTPENCRWADAYQQNRNRSFNHDSI